MTIYCLTGDSSLHAKINDLGGDKYLMPDEFEDRFEELTPQPPIPHGCLWRAPELTGGLRVLKMAKVYKKDPVPDIAIVRRDGPELMVSEAFKAFVEEHDAFGHQFRPIEFYDSKGQLRDDRKFY
jgi:hypothetical protein